MPPWLTSFLAIRRPPQQINNNIKINSLYLKLVFCLILLVKQSNCSYRGSPCQQHQWLDSDRGLCIECDRCNEQQILLRACRPDKDTICGSINEIDWETDIWFPTPPATVEHNYQQHSIDEENKIKLQQQRETNEIMWNWQTASFVLAAIACVLFLVAAAYILYQHAVQWRHMERLERRYDRDVEELSARLMHNIVDIRAVGNGRLLLQEAPRDNGFNPRDVRCVYLEQLLVGKDLIKSPVNGNVYTEEAKKQNHNNQ